MLSYTKNPIVLASAAAVSFAAFASALTVNTPASVVQCQPIQLGWGEGTAPFYVAIIPGGDPAGAALHQFDTQQGTSLTWMVDLAAGTAITVKVTDSTGAINYSDSVTINAGVSTECTSSAASGSSASSPAVAAIPAASSASSSVAQAASSASTSLALARGGASSTASSSAAARMTSSSSSAAARSSAVSPIAAAAAATTSAPANTGAASVNAKAGVSMLVGGMLLALVV